MGNFKPVLIAFALVLASVPGAEFRGARNSVGQEVGPAAGSSTRTAFVPNAGQWPADVLYRAGSGEITYWVTRSAIWMTVVSRSGDQDFESTDPDARNRPSTGTNLRLSFVGSLPDAAVLPIHQLQTTVSFLQGIDPAGWQPALTSWRGLRIAGIYHGIDLELEIRDGLLLSRLHCEGDCSTTAAPAIELRVEGAEGLALSTRAGGWGDVLVATVPGSQVIIPLPFLAGQAQNMAAESAPALSGDRLQHPFNTTVENIDTNAAHGSEESLIYSTYLGSTGVDFPNDGVVDQAGAVYVTGTTWSSNFPTTPGAFDTSANGDDEVFVSKVSSDGTSLVYSTYLGGSEDDDGHALALDPGGDLLITGSTGSTNFPVTTGVFDTSYNGLDDAFVARLNADGSELVFSTFVGGALNDTGYDVFLGPGEAVFLAGSTTSIDFPTSVGAFDTSLGGPRDAFLVKLDQAGEEAEYSTLFGGNNGSEYAYSIAVDAAGRAFATGTTSSSNFPTTPGAYDNTFNGGTTDTYVFQLNQTGTAMVYSTFIGGSEIETGRALELDALGAVIIAGNTWSDDFPVTTGAFDETYNGGQFDAFVARIHPSGGSIEYATYVGGADDDDARGMALASDGSVYITGDTDSPDFPITVGAFDTVLNNADAFVVRLDSGGSVLFYSTFLGGNSNDDGRALAVDPQGIVTVVGGTISNDFPVSPGALDETYNGSNEVFITRLDPVALIAIPIVFNNGP